MVIHAITIDHRYRENSAVEAQKVGQLVHKWNVVHHVEGLEYDAPVGSISNFEEVARAKRYQVFNEVCHRANITHLFVGHNYDDQLETCMQRIQQNSTVFGLAALKPVSFLPVNKLPFHINRPVEVIRPLLPFKKADIIDTCKQQEIEWFEDYTNQDIGLTNRNLYRNMLQKVIPQRIATEPDLQCISESGIARTLQMANHLVKYVDTRIEELHKELMERNSVEIDHSSGSVSIRLSKADIDTNGPLVLSRWFYKILFPFSASKKYHFGYTRMVNAVNRLCHTSCKFTALRLLFDVVHKDGNVFLNITRQPAMKEEMQSLRWELLSNSTFSNWICFDNRFWLRFKSKTPLHVTIEPFTKSDKQLFDIDAYMTPIFRFSDGTVALPTYGITPPGVDIEWSPKTNELMDR